MIVSLLEITFLQDFSSQADQNPNKVFQRVRQTGFQVHIDEQISIITEMIIKKKKKQGRRVAQSDIKNYYTVE